MLWLSPFELLLGLSLVLSVFGAWKKITVPDTSISYVGGTWLSATTCLLAGNKFEYGVILKSTDAGYTWSIKLTGVNRIYDIFAKTVSSSPYILAVTDSGDTISSTDEGETWTTNSISGVSFFGVTIGLNGNTFAVGSSLSASVIYKGTTASTSAWSSCTLPANLAVQLNGVCTVDGQSIVSVGNSGTILTSSSSGTGWAKRVSGVTADLYGVSCPSAVQIYAAGTSSTVLLSINGGTTWTSLTSRILGVGGLSTSDSFMLHAISAVSTTLLFVGSTNGAILKSSDSGGTWSVDTTQSTAIYSVAAYSASIGVAGGMGSSFVRVFDPTSQPTSQPSSYPSSIPSSVPSSRPSSLPSSSRPSMRPSAIIASGSWQSKSTGLTSSVFLGAAWSSASNVVMVGSRFSVGLLTRSSDMGATLTTSTISGRSFTDVSTCTLNGIVYFVATSLTGHVYTSTNGGVSWNSGVTVPYQLNGVSVSNTGYAYVVGSTNGLLTSRQSSNFTVWEDFSIQGLSVTTLHSVCSFGTYAYVGGASGIIFVSDNAATSWSLHQLGSSVFHSMACPSRNVVFAAGSSASLYKSVDRGATWTSLQAHVLGVGGITTSMNFKYHTITALSDYVIFMAASNGVVIRSTNGGYGWEVETSTSGSTFYSLSMYATNVGVASDSQGLLYFKTPPPSPSPTPFPTFHPTRQPTGQPSTQPTVQPSRQPSSQPSSQPTRQPTVQPSNRPSSRPSHVPSSQPSMQPSNQPTGQPSAQPSAQPILIPTSRPSARPSLYPSSQPSCQPSNQPTASPTVQPSSQPSRRPTAQPTLQPTSQPVRAPTSQPSVQPSRQPSAQPSSRPTSQPTRQPSVQPTQQPSRQPSTQPTRQPTGQPSRQPTSTPSQNTHATPTSRPSQQPSASPTRQPSSQPSSQPSTQPSASPISHPTLSPTQAPSHSTQHQLQLFIVQNLLGITLDEFKASNETAFAFKKTVASLISPLIKTTMIRLDSVSSYIQPDPTSQPTGQPSSQPTSQPSAQPVWLPTSRPSAQPTMQPSKQPTSRPTLPAVRRSLRSQEKSSSNIKEKSTFANIFPIIGDFQVLGTDNPTGIEVSYTLTCIVENIGFKRPNDAYKHVVNSLTTAVTTESGSQCTQALRKAGRQYTNGAFNSTSCESYIQFSNYRVVKLRGPSKSFRIWGLTIADFSVTWSFTGAAFLGILFTLFYCYCGGARCFKWTLLHTCCCCCRRDEEENEAEEEEEDEREARCSMCGLCCRGKKSKVGGDDEDGEEEGEEEEEEEEPKSLWLYNLFGRQQKGPAEDEDDYDEEDHKQRKKEQDKSKSSSWFRAPKRVGHTTGEEGDEDEDEDEDAAENKGKASKHGRHKHKGDESDEDVQDLDKEDKKKGKGFFGSLFARKNKKDDDDEDEDEGEEEEEDEDGESESSEDKKVVIKSRSRAKL